MNSSIHKATGSSTLRRAFLLIPFLLVCVRFLPTVRAVTPAPDGGYLNGNTAEGTNALFSLTTGVDNTAVGFDGLYDNTTGYYNTAIGYQALYSNTTGFKNTADGFRALYSNTTGNYNTASGFQALYNNIGGSYNTAVGLDALFYNTTGSSNTAVGYYALFANITGLRNTAVGMDALFSDTTGISNTAIGYQALFANTTGDSNTANGIGALYSNTTGGENTATGFSALVYNTTGGDNTANGIAALFSNTTGNYNIALGMFAGYNLTTGDNNIDIGNQGVAAESNTIRIGTVGTQTATYIAGIANATVAGSAVYIDTTTGQLGLLSSSERFKDKIEPMGNASEALLSLRPVIFRYKKNIDPKRVPQFGLVAEDVEKVNRDLVVRDAEGKAFTVRYEAVNAMLLNEFLKAHRKMEEQDTAITQLKSIVIKEEGIAKQQQAAIKALAASLKEQASHIQQLSAQVAVRNAAPQLAGNH